MQYSIKKGFLKALTTVVLFALPIAVDQFVVSYPEYAQLTLGGLLVMGMNYIKVALGAKLP